MLFYPPLILNYVDYLVELMPVYLLLYVNTKIIIYLDRIGTRMDTKRTWTGTW